MKRSNEELAQKSISIENDFSSASHAIATMTYDNSQTQDNRFPIPSRYNRDYLRLLPVNLSTYYIYWEVSDRTLQEQQLDLNRDHLLFRVYQGETLFHEFTSSFALGEYFLYQQIENQGIHVTVGFSNEENFVELMHSNSVHTFSNALKWPAPEDEIWIRKEKEWIELLSSTLSAHQQGGGISSAKYLEEIERLKTLSRSQINEERFSSKSLHQGGSND